MLWVGIGGFTGAVLRYLTTKTISEWTAYSRLPLGTLAVNVVGCLIIGFLSALAEAQGTFSVQAKAFVFAGTLGAFTTFSTFGSETMAFFSQGKEGLAFLNVGMHLVLGLLSVQGGRLLTSLLWRQVN